ncbi:MAG: hypothetical protein WC828_09760 [Thermoleophilia bacterium]|jgi:hypothetical protein
MHGKKKFSETSFLLLAVTLMVLSLALVSCGDESKEPESTGTDSSLVSQISNTGEVTVTVTPRNLTADASTWSFNVTMDARNGDLGEDMMQAAVITGADGSEAGPATWEGDGPGGLHREGMLKFDPQKPMPKSVTLKIRGVGGVGERSFSWMLGQ